MIVTAENKFSYVWQLPENIGRGQGVCTAQQHLCELISHIADGKPAADWDSRRWPVWLRRTWRRLGRKSMSLQWQPKMIFQKCHMHGRWGTGLSFNIFFSYLLPAPVWLIKQNYIASFKPSTFTSFLHKKSFFFSFFLFLLKYSSRINWYVWENYIFSKSRHALKVSF